MKKKKLEILLEGVKRYKNPKSFLEQYFTPSFIAADILFFAYGMGDIKDMVVADLGAGTGIFTVGACLLGAKKVYAVEIDEEALIIFKENMKKYGCSPVVLHQDIRDIELSVDTVVQNPPFGAQNKHADRPFLEKAMEISKVVYSLHNANTSEYLESIIEKFGGKITHKRFYEFPIPHVYSFHRKEEVKRNVVLYRIIL